ncbi:MAG: TIGR03663 family protein [Archaeoglobus sp.]|nr:TIGR03663 family protein [Archaeoglobus sp.]
MDKKVIAVILLITAVTRLAFLDARPIDHDESVHAWLAYDLLKEHRYSYDPAFHGPFLYFFTAGIFYIFGDSNLTSRFLPVVFSFIGIYAATRYKKWLGSGVYLFLFILLFSASILYYSRYLRNDIPVLSSFLVVLYCYFSFIEEKKERYVYLATFFLAIMVCSKENSYIYAGILASFILFYGIWEERTNYLKKLLKPSAGKVKVVLISAIIFLSIFVPLYSAGFSDLDGLRRATVGAVEHWFTMHASKDHAKPALYYAGLLLRYEFLPVALSIASIPEFYRKLKNKEATKLELFSAYWLLMTLVAYQILSHKVPWLVVHLVAPMALFSSLMLKDTLNSWRNRGFRAAVVFLAAIYLASSLHLSYVNYNDASEGLIYIQVQPSAVELANKIIERENSGEHGLVFETHNDYWPLPWYLRHINMAFSSRLYGKFDYYVTSEINAPLFKNCKLEGRYEIRPGYYMDLFENCKGKI